MRYKTIVFEMTIYYVLLAISLPLVYASTYQLPFISMFQSQWGIAVISFYPLVFVIAGIQFLYQKFKENKYLSINHTTN